jgi:hypothetical protein
MYYAGIRMGINAGVLDIVLSCHLLDPLIEILAQKNIFRLAFQSWEESMNVLTWIALNSLLRRFAMGH